MDTKEAAAVLAGGRGDKAHILGRCALVPTPPNCIKIIRPEQNITAHEKIKAGPNENVLNTRALSQKDM